MIQGFVRCTCNLSSNPATLNLRMKHLKESSALEQAFFDQDFQILLVSLYENERPLKGLAGRMDWLFYGQISYFLKQGFIHGRPDEYVLIPVRKNHIPYSLLLIGAGASTKPGKRIKLSAGTLSRISSHLSTLGTQKVGLSLSDFGDVSPESLKKHFPGAELWISQ